MKSAALRRLVRAVALAGIIVAAAEPAFAQHAVVQSANQVGQAWLFRKDGKCYALTAEHVVEGPDIADLLVSGVGTSRAARARVIARWPRPKDDKTPTTRENLDLALLRVESGAVDNCGPLLVLPLEVSRALDVGATGELRLVDDKGGVQIHRASVLEVDKLSVMISSDDNLAKTMSGSTFFVGNTPFGLFVKIHNVGPSKDAGELVRMDVATTLALDRIAAGDPPAPAPEKPTDGCKPTALSELDLAADKNGGKIVAWSSLPEGPAFGPENLISTTSCSAWQIRKPEYPVSIVVDLAGDRPVRISQVVLDGSGVKPPELPREVEILTRQGSTGGWSSAGTFTFPANAPRLTVPLPATAAAQVMLKVYSGGSAERIALRRIIVLRAQ